MNAYTRLAVAGHESVTFFQDRRRSFQAIIGVHSTAIGPALGGCRMREYPTIEDAFTDVLNLSEAMSFKNSLCGIGFGGGKSVILIDRKRTYDRDELFTWFGKCVESLGGKYITAEDMGTSVSDMSRILRVTRYVAGRDPNGGGGGDPSPFTAEGVFHGMRAALERRFGSPDFRGKQIAIQGVGHVGSHLVRLLVEAGAQVVVSDVSEANCDAAKKIGEVTVVPVDRIVAVECEIFSPCAVGGTVNRETLQQLRCAIVAGAANNQLREESVEQELVARGIVYVPDFAINAGGVILCADEFEPGGFSPARVHERVSQIYHTVGRILDQSKSSGKPAGQIARSLAEERIELASRKQ